MGMVDVFFNDESILQQTLDKEVYVIGRQEGCDIRIDNLGISRNHARLVRDGSGYVVEDMNSSNGTFVNGEQVDKHRLNDGDEIAIGKYLIIFKEEAGAAAPAKKEEHATVQAAENPLGGDALNTMAMDGDAIRKRLEALHKEKESRAEQPSPLAKNEEQTTAKTKSGLSEAELKAREAEIKMLESRLKSTKLIVAVVVVLLIAGGAIAYFLLNK